MRETIGHGRCKACEASLTSQRGPGDRELLGLDHHTTTYALPVASCQGGPGCKGGLQLFLRLVSRFLPFALARKSDKFVVQG
jgi:hypothetical protein